LASGITRAWQKRSPSGTGTWTTISGATLVNYTESAGITASTDYRSILTCTESGLSDTTNIVTVNINDFSLCYCTPSATSPTINYITNVTTTEATLNFANSTTTGSATSAGYSNYFATHEASAVQGASFSISVTETGSA